MFHPVGDAKKSFCATKELRVRFRKPLLAEHDYVVAEGWMVREGDDECESAGRILDPAGEVIAEGSWTYKVLPKARLDGFFGGG